MADVEDLRQRLLYMANTAEKPEDREWAAEQYRTRFHGAEHRSVEPSQEDEPKPGPWRSEAALPRTLPEALAARSARLEDAEAATGRRLDKQRGPVRPVEAGVMGLGQGLTANHLDEIGGVVEGLSSKGFSRGERYDLPLRTPPPPPAPDGRSFGQAYDEGRDALRGLDQRAQQQHGRVYLGSNLLGAILSPLRLGAGKGAGQVMLRAAGEGMLAGEGASTAGLDEPLRLGLDTGVGGALSAGGGGIGRGVANVGRWAAGKVSDALPRRILNEVAEGATATGRKRLEGAQGAIAEEVLRPDTGNAVRAAYLGPGREGAKKLEPMLQQLRGQRATDYALFDAAGTDVVPGVRARLEAAAGEAAQAGKLTEAKAIERLMVDLEDLSRRNNGKLSMEAMRGLTTETQGAAASALGSLNEHKTAKLARKLSAIASDAMDGALDDAATTPELQRAAGSIRETNKRFNAQLSISERLKQRGQKEASAASGLKATATKVAGSAAIGGAVGAVAAPEGGRGEGAVKGALVGSAIVKGLPAAAGAIDRGITTQAIKSARGQLLLQRLPQMLIPNAATAGRAARPAIGPGIGLIEAVAARNRKKQRGE